MLHIKSITTGRGTIPEKGIDPAGAIFLQIWFFVASWIIGEAFGTKD